MGREKLAVQLELRVSEREEQETGSEGLYLTPCLCGGLSNALFIKGHVLVHRTAS